MPSYLSAEWYSAAAQYLSSHGSDFGVANATVAVEHRISGGQTGDLVVHEVYDNGNVTRMGVGALEGWDLRIRWRYADAVESQQGLWDEERFLIALTDGEVRVSGSLDQLRTLELLRHSDAGMAFSRHMNSITEF